MSFNINSLCSKKNTYIILINRFYLNIINFCQVAFSNCNIEGEYNVFIFI